MSNDLIPANIQVPAYLKVQKSGIASALAVTFEGRPQISIMGSKWAFIENGIRTPHEHPVLTVVILGVDPPAPKAVTKAYFLGNYSPDSVPECFSDDGVYPSSRITNPQHDNCAQCPQNVWGSAKSKLTGDDVKACKDHKVLLVSSPDGVEKGTIFFIRVPATSFKSLTAYGNSLEGHGIPVEGVITVMRFAPGESYPQLEFSFGGFLPEEAAHKAAARAKSSDVQAMLHYPPQQAPARRAPIQQAPVQQEKENVQATAWGGAQNRMHQSIVSAPAPQEDPWATAAPVQQMPVAALPMTFRPPYTARNSPPEVHTAIQPTPVAGEPPQCRDVTGAAFNADFHATGRDGKPSILSDGTFRKRRGGVAPASWPISTHTGQAPATVPTPAQSEQLPEDIGDLLKAWQPHAPK